MMLCPGHATLILYSAVMSPLFRVYYSDTGSVWELLQLFHVKKLLL